MVLRFIELPQKVRAILRKRQNSDNLIRCLGFNPEQQIVRRTSKYVVIRPSAQQYPHIVELRFGLFDDANWIFMLLMTVEATSFTNIIDLVVVSKYFLEWGLALDYEEPNRTCRKLPLLMDNSRGERYEPQLRMHLKQDPTISCTFLKELNVPGWV